MRRNVLKTMTVPVDASIGQAGMVCGFWRNQGEQEFPGSEQQTMRMTKGTRRALVVAAIVAALTSPTGAGVIGIFNGGGIGTTYTTFSALRAGYEAFIGNVDPTAIITFNDLAIGTAVTNQYSPSEGVTFSNSSDWLQGVSYEGYVASGSIMVEGLDGYDGTYAPNGDKVYAKVRNTNVATPLTITFATPRFEVGSFIAMGKEGTIDTYTIEAFNAAGVKLTSMQVKTALWNEPSNREGFWGVKSDTAEIVRITILNNSNVDYASAVILDNVIPEPASLTVLILGGLVLLRPRRR